MNLSTENTFETALLNTLTEKGAYKLGSSPTQNIEMGFFNEDIIDYLKNGQK